MAETIRLVVVEVGLDGHEVVEASFQENADAIGVAILSGAQAAPGCRGPL